MVAIFVCSFSTHAHVISMLPGYSGQWFSQTYRQRPGGINRKLLRVHQNSNSLQWRHNERGGVSNHQPHDCLLNCSIRRRSKKTSKLRVTGFCEWNSPVTSEFPTKMASNAENVSIWWRHHVSTLYENCISECMGKIFCGETRKAPLN